MEEEGTGPSRAERLASLSEHAPEVVVVGGGITGAGVALDLALRGVRTLIVERSDWASATSSSSSRLIHGGLRYLEGLHIPLVRESCFERSLLLHNAAGLVWPERFLFPVCRGDRVGLAKMGMGLLLYTAVSLPRPLGFPSIISRARVAEAIPGIASSSLRGAGAYLDGATDDARLTLAVLRTAVQVGAVSSSRTEVTAIETGPSGAEVHLRDVLGDTEARVPCRAVVLAAGPFTDGLRERAGLARNGNWIAPTRGSHVLVPRDRLSTDGAVIFPSSVDGRVLFLIPWPRYTVIGTTDLDSKPGDAVRATREEVRYLLDSANALVSSADLGEEDVVSTWAGLRPLLTAPGKPSSRSREERIERDGCVFTVAGGKLTSYRSMAEKVAARVVETIEKGRRGRASPTRDQRLVGALEAPVARPRWSNPRASGLDPRRVAWARRYAGLSDQVERFCARIEGGTEPLDPETWLGEIDWAVTREDCLRPADFFLRRTDLGYGPQNEVEAASGAVLERMTALLGWSIEERSRAAREFRAELGLRHAWRDD